MSAFRFATFPVAVFGGLGEPLLMGGQLFARRIAVAALAALLTTSFPAQAQEVPDANRLRPSQDPARTANGLAQTPPMGWNSWNKFGCDIDETIVRRVADAMVSSGMKDAG